jgi:hypothetical protein
VHQYLAVRLKDVAYAEPNEGSNWFNIVYDMYSSTAKVSNWFDIVYDMYSSTVKVNVALLSISPLQQVLCFPHARHYNSRWGGFRVSFLYLYRHLGLLW